MLFISFTGSTVCRASGLVRVHWNGTSFGGVSQAQECQRKPMVQFLALGLQIPADHPDRRKYYSLNLRQAELDSSDLGEITVMSPGDILVLYIDGVYDGSDAAACELLELVMREHYRERTKRSATRCSIIRLGKMSNCAKTAMRTRSMTRPCSSSNELDDVQHPRPAPYNGVAAARPEE